MKSTTRSTSLIVCMVAMVAGSALAQTTVTDFSSGSEGWQGLLGETVAPTGGNPGAFFSTAAEFFGVEYFNNTNQAFLGDYTAFDRIDVSIDIRVDNILFGGFTFPSQVARNFVVEFRNHNIPSDVGSPVSAFFILNEISAASTADWTTLSVSFDPNSATLPSGFGGNGGFSDTFEPVLPAGVSFADVISGVTEISFSTFEPGFVYGLTTFELGVDNISITKVVPAPSSIALLAACGVVYSRRRR